VRRPFGTKITSLALAVGAAFAATIVGASSGAAAPVPAGTLYTIDWDNATLFSVDPATATTTLVGAGSRTAIPGLIADSATGLGYAVNYDGACDFTRIDLTTGASTTIGPTGVANCTGLDVNHDTGTIYVVYDHPTIGGASILGTIDVSTGDITNIGTVTLSGTPTRITSLAVQPGTGTLYAGGYDGDLYTVDPPTAALTLVRADVIGGASPDGLTFDCTGENLYAVRTSELYNIDLSGTFTDVGAMDLDDGFTENLAVACDTTFPPPEEEPAPTIVVRFTG
jgi:hypothetical protein